ncbi:MAG: bifunctional riboflavin kinase/FAD synthetase [Gammaproteobacteria bacterium]
MELIRGLHNLRSRHSGCVATIGNFDGVHLGHRAVLARLFAKADAYGAPSLVMVFEPTPQEFFARGNVPARLTRFREKYEALAEIGVDRMLCIHFDQQYSQVSAEQFVSDVLVDGLGVQYLVVGDDFRFGHRRRGDFAMLQHCGRRDGFEVEHTPTFEIDGERVSSSRIRRLLLSGDIGEANRLLGRPYRMSGRIVPGQRLGRELGYPTANIRPGRRVLALQGVFAVRVDGKGLAARDAVASIGTRPTIEGDTALLEVHVFNFDGDLYGQHVHVDFFAKLRDEQRFESLEALTEQMHRDAAQARRILGAGALDAGTLSRQG